MTLTLTVLGRGGIWPLGDGVPLTGLWCTYVVPIPAHCTLPHPKQGAWAALRSVASLHYSLIGMTGRKHSNPGGSRAASCLITQGIPMAIFFFFSPWKFWGPHHAGT